MIIKNCAKLHLYSKIEICILKFLMTASRYVVSDKRHDRVIVTIMHNPQTQVCVCENFAVILQANKTDCGQMDLQFAGTPDNMSFSL